jgi:hypothetical protein
VVTFGCCGSAQYKGGRRYHSRCAAHRPQLQIELPEFGIHNRCLQHDEIAAGAIIHRIALPLHRCQLVRDGRDHAQRERGVGHMPVLVPETPVSGRILVAAELGPHGVVDQLGQVVRDLDI